MIPRLAARNLLQGRARLLASVGGLALALSLVLSLDAVLAGTEEQVTAYIDHAGADLFVSQSGVRNMHMASSSLPASLLPAVESQAGVESVTPILYVTNMIGAGSERYLAYVIGLPAEPKAGGPWRIVEGSALPGPGEAIIDRVVADQAGLRTGDEVRILGRPFAVAGVAAGTASLVNSVAFISAEDFLAAQGFAGTVSYLLVRVRPGESPARVAAAIERDVEGVTVQTRQEFSRQERRVVRDMSTDVTAIMNLIGLLIGLAVMALTIYGAALARRAEYGVLKALGARNRVLYAVVVLQTGYAVLLGFALALAFTLLLSAVAPMVAPTLALSVTFASLTKVAVLSLVIAACSSILPARHVAGLEPAAVFRAKV